MPTPRRTVDSDLRAYLLSEAVWFRRAYGKEGVGKTADGKTAWELLSGPVDVLLEGKPFRLHRFQLPDWHNESTRYGGSPHDDFELGADDVLRPYDGGAEVEAAERAGHNGAPVDGSLLTVKSE